MAIAEVGSGTQRATGSFSGVDSGTLAYPGNITSGSLLICSGGTYVGGTPNQTHTVTDTRSTPYSTLEGVAHNAFSGDYKNYIAYGIAASSGACTVTLNPSGAVAYGQFAIDEFSGVDTGTPLQVNGGETTATSTTCSDSITTTGTNALLIGTMSHHGGSNLTITPGGSYTQIGESENVAIYPYNVVFRIATTAQAYTVDWTIGSSIFNWGQTAAFSEASAGGTPASKLLTLLGVGQ